MNERTLTWPQYDFIHSKACYPAFVGGYGSGKSESGVVRLLKKKYEAIGLPVSYYTPTYDLLYLEIIPRIEYYLQAANVPYKYDKSKMIVDIYGAGKIIARSMDNPNNIRGYQAAHAVIDELDTLNRAKAKEAFERIVGRTRLPLPNKEENSIGVVTTPEGFKFVYEKWKKEPMVGSEIIHASTYSNPHNNASYIQSLKNTYPAQLLEAYLEGRFVNLTSGCVYPEFDRVLNACNTVVEASDTLHIGMDFNIGKMAAAIHVMRDGLPYAVAEIVNVLDTPAMIAMIKRRYPGHSVIVYPDASGGARNTTGAAESDLALLRQAGFTVLCASRNPAVRDRVISFNVMINKDGVRRYKINPDTCPHIVEALEKQAYDKNGEPDKTSGFDHPLDASGYFIYYRYPIQSRGGVQSKIRGL